MANIAELKQALGAGARTNKYQINFSIPSAVPTTSDLKEADVLCKATQFPGMSITPIEVYSQGRKLLIPGATEYENTWTLTFYNTEAHNLRRDMIAWMKAADDFQKNIHSGNPNDILGELGVVQLDSDQKETVTYTFHNVWVSEVAAIELTADGEAEISEFEVTFSFSDWVVGTGEYSEPGKANAPTKNAIAP